jgi:SPP1 gp7 family putative phage head morphogenesis protein
MIRHAIGIQRVAGHNVDELDQYFNRVNADIINLAGSDPFVVTRRQAISREAYNTVLQIYQEMGEEILTQSSDMAANEIQFVTDALNKATTADVDISDVQGMIQRAIDTPMRVDPGVTELTISRAVDQFGENKSLEFFRLISDGVLEGKTGSEMAKEAQELLKSQRHAANTLVRTANNSIAASAREQLFEQNKDIISAYEWVAKLDHRTTEICTGLDEKVFKVGKGPLPPAHWNCRSQTVAVVNKKYRKEVDTKRKIMTEEDFNELMLSMGKTMTLGQLNAADRRLTQ